jgi:hypothetical protein
MPNAADLIALARDHRIWAERSKCVEEYRQLHRVADIYEALATIELPLATVTEAEDPPHCKGRGTLRLITSGEH